MRLRTPTNWTAVLFLALLGGAHLAIALPAAFSGRWEGCLSFALAAVFLAAAYIAFGFQVEMAVLCSRGEIRLRAGTPRWHVQRRIAFDAVSAVRLTVYDQPVKTSEIALVCTNEEIDFPPTAIPGQQALFLAMMIGVTLIKVGRKELD